MLKKMFAKPSKCTVHNVYYLGLYLNSMLGNIAVFEGKILSLDKLT